MQGNGTSQARLAGYSPHEGSIPSRATAAGERLPLTGKDKAMTEPFTQGRSNHSSAPKLSSASARRRRAARRVARASRKGCRR
jgi:hypothetical protein